MKPANPAQFVQAVGDIRNHWLNINQPPGALNRLRQNQAAAFLNSNAASVSQHAN
jgi:hypothetical protein